LATEPAEKDRSLRTLAVDELAKLAAEERGPRLKAVLRELGQRKGDEAVAALAAAAGGYETTIKDLARDQLTRVLSRLDEDTLKATLSDQRPELRRAAILAIQQKKLAWGAELIERLKDDNAEVRDAAHQALVKLPGATDLGPDAKAGTAERTEAVVRWKAWWDKQDHR
jgi:HEAT repeat protein